MPTKTWAVGEEVLAADFNTMVQRQVVATFPNAAARTAAIAAPTAGMLTYLTDVKSLQEWDGAAWVAHPPVQIRAGSAVVTLNAAGWAVVSYPVSFLSQTVSVVVCCGDTAITPNGVYAIRGTPNPFDFVVQVNHGNDGSPWVNVTVRVNYIAYGV